MANMRVTILSVFLLAAFGGCKKDKPDEESPAAATPTGEPEPEPQTTEAPEPTPKPVAAPGAEAVVTGDGGEILGLQTARGHLIVASAAEGGVRVAARLPEGAGEDWSMTARILSPMDEVVASGKLMAEDATGRDAELTLDAEVTGEQWPLHRLEYQVRGADGADERVLCSLQRFKQLVSARVFVGDTLLAGGPLAMRVIVSDPATATPISGAAVSVRLGDDQLITARTGADGELAATTKVPANASSDTLVVRVSHGTASAEVARKVTVRRERRILVTTDKPLYQPGQTVHLRSLAVRRPDLVPLQFAATVFEVFDAKGNKVFKRKAKASQQGVASARFELASEVNMGRFRVKVTVDDTSSERTVDVKRYTLPKYKVAIETKRAFYRPGRNIDGTVDASYFFGKPVTGKVSLQLDTFDVGWSRAATAEGRTNLSGVWPFSVKLPASLVGQPVMQGKAMARLTVTVVDSAGQQQTAVKVLPVSSEPLAADVVVSGGRIVPKVLNDVFVLVSTPDGAPVKGATVRVRYGDEKSQAISDEAGLAALVVTGGAASKLTVFVSAPSGASLQKEVTFDVGVGKVQLALAVANPAASVGDSLSGVVRATGGLDRVFLDLIRDGQPILTDTVTLENGEGDFSVPLTADHAGTLLVQAWHVGGDMTVVRDARPAVVTHASQLKVQLEATKKTTYKPGEDAKLALIVTGKGGGPVPSAAVGVRIVDEALFALVEERPGLAQLFFALDEELMTPKLQVNAYSPADLGHATRGLVAARVLSAASDRTWTPAVAVDTARLAMARVREAYQERFERDAKAIYDAFAAEVKSAANDKLTAAVWDAMEDGPPPDPWGTIYRLDSEEDPVKAFAIRSAGPDEAFDTGDDMVIESDVFVQRERERMDFAIQEGGVPIPATAGVPGGFGKGGAGAKSAGDPGVRVRQFFPETLYVNPLLITDERGRAEFKVTMADSITKWRLSATASDVKGRLGSGTDGVVVFQDFFVDVDVPESMTQSDEVTVPIAVYNYMKQEETIVLTPDLGTGFERVGEAEELVVALQPGEVKGVQLRIKAIAAGVHTLTVHARGNTMSDAVRRPVRVVPNGREHVANSTGTLNGKVTVDVEFPKTAIGGGNGLLVKLYPGSFSQVVEGLDSVLRMPSGCFEQTSSTTYPNVLALRYMREKKRVTPEVEVKALSYINQGWQRLLTFEVDGGGFSWFGDQPANKVLTAFGVQEFADMGRVYDTDPKVLARTQAWLAKQQEPDGFWKPDKSHLHDENWGDIQKGSLMTTAYIARALAVSGYAGKAMTPALNWLDKEWRGAKDAYTLSLLGGAFAAKEPTSATTGEIMQALKLLAVRSEDDRTVYWPAGVRTAVYGNGKTANIETTALAVMALMTTKKHMELVKPALNWLVEQKDDNGTWHATMPTILALSALVQALTDSTETMQGKVRVAVDGNPTMEWTLTKDDAEVVRQLDLADYATTGKHTVTIEAEGKGAPLYQVVGRHWIPELGGGEQATPAFELGVTYDKTALQTYDVVTATATVISLLNVDSRMLLLDLAVPPGFEVLRQDLDTAVAQERISRYDVKGRSIIVYLDQLAAGKVFKLSWRLRARLSVRANSGVSRVYQYYDPAKKGRAAATLMTVDG